MDPEFPRAYEKAKVYFMRRYLNVAMDAPVSVDDPEIAGRLEDLSRVAKHDIVDLHAEFAKFPLPDFSSKSLEEKASELGRIYPDQTFEAVPGSANKVKINDLVEFDATSLRRLPPSQRKQLFDASKMPEGEEKTRALKKLGASGSMRLRIPKNAADGRAHLSELVQPSQQAKLDGLYDAPGTRIEDKYRAWDILNKINEGEPEDAKRLETERHAASLQFALDLDPENLPDMVECFEFADLIIDREIKRKARELSERGVEEDYAKRLENERQKPLRLAEDIARLGTDIRDLEQRIAEARADGSDTAALAKTLEQKTMIRNGKQSALDKLPPDPATHVKRKPVPSKPTTAENRTAAEAVLQELRDNPERHREMAKAIAMELSTFVNAVSTTGNTAGACPCDLVPDDVLPNAGAAVGVADKLRFGSNRAAAYHTQKHFEELSRSDRSGSTFGTEPERRVDRYHTSARATVRKGDCTKSSVGQNGGESHLFKGSPCTAIVWLNGGQAGMATYFNL